mgnify:FL=1
MEKKVLSEIALYYGDVSMPKDWEIDPIELAHYILQYQIDNKKFSFSRTWDKLNTYIREHIRLEYNIKLINKKTWGNIYSPHETTPSLLDVDPIDLKHSPDYTLLYGVKVDNCCVKICYDDNKRKGRTWTIPLSNNKFIMFPSTNMYSIINNQKDSLNFIQTITYEFN